MGFLDPCPKDTNSCTILFLSLNSNGCPSTNPGLLVGTYISSGLNTTKGISIPILSFYSSLAYGPPCVCCCYCLCCCKFCGLPLLSIYSSYMSPFVCGCCSTFGDLVSLSFLIFFLYSLICLSYGNNICGALTLCLLNYTNVGIANGSTFPFVIFWALNSVLSYFFLTPHLEVPPYSTLLFLFRAFLGNFVATFLLFSNVVYISSLVLLTLVCGFYGLFFC